MTPWEWFKIRWKTILTVALIAIAVTAVNVASVYRYRLGSDLGVRAMWPTRLSRSIDTQIQVVATGRKGEALVGAKVALFEAPSGSSSRDAILYDSLKPISQGTTSATGVATLEMPRVTAGSRTMTEGKLHAILKVEHGGQIRYLSRVIALSGSVSSVVTLDRTLYQPGQRVLMRALALDTDTGVPVPGVATWKIHDPQHNLVYEETTPLSAAGVAQAEFSIARPCLQGLYRLTAVVAGATITRDIEVRPFRLPRFKVAVRDLPGVVEAGAKLRGRVRATYTYGDPVAKAPVSIDIVTRSSVGARQEVVRGETNAEGEFVFTYALPLDITPGTSVEAIAKVTSAAGRAEEGRGQTQTAGGQPIVEVVPVSAPTFRYHQTNRAYVLLQDAKGAPLANARVAMSLPEGDTERDVITQTDAKGRAPFTWRPQTNSRNVISLRATLADGADITRNLRIPVESRTSLLQDYQATAQVGQDYAIKISNTREPLRVVLAQRGLIIAATELSPGQTQATLKLERPARGLNSLMVIGAHGDVRDQRSLWVEQRGGSRVSVEADAPEYRPGTQAKVTLAFPPSAGEGTAPKAPVTFGLIGVDEAVYALKERTDLPLTVLIRGAPSNIGGALRGLDAIDTSDPISRAIGNTRFQQNLRAPGGDASEMMRSRDINSSLERAYQRTRARWVATLWLLAFLLTALGTLRETWRAFLKEAFSWKRLGMFVGGAVAIVPVAFFLGSMHRSGAGLMGGALVWSMVLVGWLIGAAWRDQDSNIRTWLAGLGICLVLGVNVAIAIDPANPSSDYETFVLFALGTPLVLLAIQFLLWPFFLLHHGHTHAGMGLATVMLAPMGTMFFAVAAGPMAQESTRAFSPIPDRFANAKMGGDAAPMEPAPESIAMNKPSPKKPDNGGGPRVRAYFPETMIFAPEVASGPDGKAMIPVEVPDSITTWRLNAYAHTWDGRVGEGQTGMVVRQPFFVELDMPMDFRQGDRFAMPVTLVNNAKKPLDVTVTLEAGGALQASKAPRVVRVEAGARAPMTFDVEATGLGQGTMTVRATTGDRDLEDAVRREATVAPDGRMIRASTSSFLQETWTPKVAMPTDMIPGSGRSDVYVMPGPFAQAFEGLESILRMPTGCFEQTSSANYPNTILLKVLRSTPAKDWPTGEKKHAEALEKASRMLSLGYQRMLTFRKGGGFALYPHKSPEIMLTAYGLLQLLEMRAVTKIDPATITSAAQWLAQRQRKNGAWPVWASRVAGGSWQVDDDIGQLRATSFVVLALASLPKKERAPFQQNIDRGAERIMKRMESAESANALAYAANALHAAGKPEGARKALSKLTAMLTVKPKVAFWQTRRMSWMGAYGGYADVETTALGAYAFLATKEPAPQLPRMLAYLARSRSTRGGWGSTQTTVWALRTMMKLSAGAAESADLKITHNGAPMAHANGRGEPGALTVKRTSLLMRQLGDEKLLRGENRLRVETSAKSNAMVQWRVQAAVPWTSEAANVAGERLGVRFRTPTTMAYGAPVELSAQIRNTGPRALGALIVELPLLPGSFTPRATFEKMQKRGQIDRFEILGTHVRLYVSGMNPNQIRNVTYKTIPLLRGAFSMPPVRAYLFYAPDPVTERDGGDIVVR